MRFTRALVSIIAVTPVCGFSPVGVSQLNSLNTINNNNLSFNRQYATIANGEAVNGGSKTNGEAEEEEEKSEIPAIRLSVEEKAKTVISVCTSGTLCTTSTSEGIAGSPFGSFVDYVLDDDGNPILLMNEMSMHTMNIVNDPEGMVSLFTQLDGSNPNKKGNGQDVSRCSITGTVEKINADEAEDMDTIRMRYSITHAYADQVMDSPKFAFYRIKPAKVYFVGGFGVLAKWVPVEEYKEAAADILSKEAADIVSRLNRDNSNDLSLTATHLLGCGLDIERVRVTSVDRLGMDIRVTTMGRRKKLNTDEFRIGFRIPVISVEDAKSEILKVFQEAWEKANGYSWGEDESGTPGSDIPIIKIAADSLG